jgi:hypothetical protein
MLDADKAMSGLAVVVGEMQSPAEETRSAGAWLQLGSLLLPIIKCAFCPVCLSLFGTAVAGARLGFLADERCHGVLITVAVIIDGAIFAAGRRHHRGPGPLVLCGLGALVAMAGHLAEVAGMEIAGLGALMVAAFWNVLLLRQHRHRRGGCCDHAARPVSEGRMR